MVWITHDNSKNEYQELASGYLVPYTISMNFLSVSFCIALNNI